MIVIVIMGVVYTLAIDNFQKLDNKASKLSLKNLKEYLLSIPHKKSVKLLCIDTCTDCFLLVDGKKSDAKLNNFIDDSVRVYRYDFNLGAMQKENQNYFNKEGVEENVCFSYEVDSKGVGDQVLVEYKKLVYDFSPYFETTTVYNSVEDAVSTKQNLATDIIR